MNQRMDTGNTYELLQQNQEQGIELLYERYGKKLYSYAITSWKLNEDDAWETVYQTLYKVMEKFAAYTFENEKKFGSFIFTVFCNLLRRHYRDNKRISEQLSFATYDESRFDASRGDASLSTERKVQSRITEISMDSYRDSNSPANPLMEVLEKALDELEAWQRILVLQRIQNVPYNDIAAYVNRPANQLKVYYSRIMKKLEKQLVQEENVKKEEVNG